MEENQQSMVLAITGNIITSDGENHLNYICIFVHRLICIIDNLDTELILLFLMTFSDNLTKPDIPLTLVYIFFLLCVDKYNVETTIQNTLKKLTETITNLEPSPRVTTPVKILQQKFRDYY